MPAPCLGALRRERLPLAYSTDGPEIPDDLCVADAATFPFLPAKNHTLTLMANAVRLADRLL